MIVSCPGCSREYRINKEQVEWATIPDTNELGVKLLCASCEDAWWEKQPSSKLTSSQKRQYHDQTDLAFMVSERDFSREYEAARKDIKMPPRAVPLAEQVQVSTKQAPSIAMPSFPQHDESKINGVGRTSSSKDFSTEKSRFPYGWFVFFLTLVAIIGAVGFVFFKEQLFQKDLTSVADQRKDFVVQNVNYDIRQIDNENIITVVGEIGNPNVNDAPVPSLEVLLLGPCPNSEGDAKPLAEEALCTLYNWPYHWDFSHIHAGEKVTFHTHAKIPSDLIVSRVDIDLKE